MVKPMLDVNAWEIVGLAVDVGVVCLLNYFYRNKVKDAELVNSAQSYDVGGELRDAVFASSDKSLPYVCVSGLTKCIGPPLKSSYNDAVGVIQHQLYVEHKSKRTQGFWTDVKRAIKDKLNVRPFALVSSDDPDGPISVEVTDALSAEYLKDSLEIVHDHYQPASDGLLSRGLDRLFGEVTKGYQETESMLKVGVQLVGVGKLIQAGRNRLLLVPPEGGRRYILITTSKQELVRTMRADARALNIARWVFLIAGSAAFLYIVYRSVKLYRRHSESERMLEELRNRRQNATDTNTAGVDQQDTTCVVCLHQRREVVLLNCGHICLCGDCATALPSPKLCPVCRAPVARIIPTYNS